MNRTASIPSALRRGLPVVLAGALLSLPSTAQAAPAWQTMFRMHGALAQICKQPATNGWLVKVRVDNRGGRHMHRVHLGNHAGTRFVDTRAAAGTVSRVASLVSTRGVQFGIGDADGDQGAVLELSDVRRC